MKLFRAEQIREADRYTIENEPVSSTGLMERAGKACYNWIIERFNSDKVFTVLCGPGNNGGDGLVIARLLVKQRKQVNVWVVNINGKYSPDFEQNKRRLLNLKPKSFLVFNVEKEWDKHFSSCYYLPDSIIIDAIFGTGLSRPVDGIAARIIRDINAIPATKISVDIPSGMLAEDNSKNKPDKVFRADYTLSLQFPKLSMLLPAYGNNTGELHIIPIGLHPDYLTQADSPYYYTEKKEVLPLFCKPEKFAHKGNNGHALLVSGSKGKAGAAYLAAKAALRTGCGLLTARVPASVHDIFQTLIPEAMAEADENSDTISGFIDTANYNAIGVGPGIGLSKATQQSLKMLIQNAKLPMVLDADALNILGENKTWLSFLPSRTILTPHPKEFSRICGATGDDFPRLEKLSTFSKKHQIIVVLKGAHTAIALPNGDIHFNSTGNPGLAKAGSGDVLTGIILGLLCRKLPPEHAAIAGVYLHGLAADIAVEKTGTASLMATDTIEHIGEAMKSLVASS